MMLLAMAPGSNPRTTGAALLVNDFERKQLDARNRLYRVKDVLKVLLFDGTGMVTFFKRFDSSVVKLRQTASRHDLGRTACMNA